MPNDRKPPSRSRKPASPPRKPASRARTPKDDPIVEQDLDTGIDDDLEAPPVERARPVGVGVGGSEEPDDERAGALVGSDPFSDSDVLTAEGPPAEAEAAVERPLVELGVGLVALLLAASVVLKPFGWFINRQGTVPSLPIGAKATGWSASIWGPLVFFLALAVVAIIVLRRLKVPLAFPFETSTIIEGIGYTCVGLLLLSRFLFRPAGWEENAQGWFISVILAAALFLLAGMMSTSAPFVLKPGWFASVAGKTGAMVVGFALLGGAAFGFVNDPPGPRECGEDLPKHSSLEDLKLTEAQQAGGKAVCTGFTQAAPASAATLKKFFTDEFKKLRWKATAETAKAGRGKLRQTTVRLFGPKYAGTIIITPLGKTSAVVVIISDPRDFGRCQTTDDCIYE